MDNAFLFDLSSHAKVELSGPEARQFLHNLCTQDVKNLADGAGCEAFLTTAKAHVVSHIFVGNFRVNEQAVLWLDAVPGQASVLVQHLNHYLISEQVEVSDRTAELGLYRLVGTSAQGIIERAFGCDLAGLKHLGHVSISLPGQAAGFVRRFDGLSLAGFDIFFPHGTTLNLEVPFADPGLHEVLRVEAGFPAFGKDIDDNRLVMEIGRTAQAICYTKGCFLGQEPIVIAHDRGQVNRQLLGIKLAAGAVLTPGSRLFKAEAEVGQVTSSVRSERLNQVIALAYLKRGFQTPGLDLVVEPTTDGRLATVTTLPFIS